ncbi:MAG: glycoside hydrolase family 57 protein [bacterium]
MASGFLNIVLHAHLPYIEHPRDPYHIEQRWLYEAVTESYIPLIDTFTRLCENGIPFHVTLSLSPPLCAMLTNRHLQERCEEYIRNQISLAAFECTRTQGNPSLYPLSKRYLEDYTRILHSYLAYGSDLIRALQRLKAKGVLSLMTSSATHAYLPLLEDYPAAVHAQIRGGLELFRRTTGEVSEGFWLPECGYSADIEAAMKKNGVPFTVIDSHGVIFGRPFPSSGVYQPLIGPSGILLFGRDSATSELIWSAESGYPADPDYRDFYADVASDLPDAAVREFLHPGGIRVPSGIKYRKITGKGEKDWYDPVKASLKVGIHAEHFIRRVSGLIDKVSALMSIKPVITVAFDAELFGHWWHEGCFWLEHTLSGFARNKDITFISGGAFHDGKTGFEHITPEQSSWGYRGYHETWINPRNDWMIGPMQGATELALGLARRHRATTDRATVRALNRMTRELFLLQSSDWSFMIDRGISESYARERFLNHADRLTRIARMITEGKKEDIDPAERDRAEGTFLETDFRWLIER